LRQLPSAVNNAVVRKGRQADRGQSETEVGLLSSSKRPDRSILGIGGTMSPSAAEISMLGTMMDFPLTLVRILERAAWLARWSWLDWNWEG
jgi:hypothetical protein